MTSAQQVGGQSGQPQGSLPRPVAVLLRVLVVMVAILAFAAMFGYGVYETWAADSGEPPHYSEAFVYVATGLASLVGGIVAVGFGQKSPRHNPTIQPLMMRNIAGLARLMAPPAVNWQSVLASAYALVYVVWGIAAIATWVLRTAETPDLVGNLATTFLGMALPIIAAFFREAQ